MEHKADQELERLEQLLVSCVQHWKQDQDAAGYADFIRFLEQLECCVDLYFDRIGERKEHFIANLNVLYRDVQNKDIIAIDDVVERELAPFIRGWRKVVIPDERKPNP